MSNWRQVLSWQEQPNDEMDGIGVKYWMEYDDTGGNPATYVYDKLNSESEIKYWIREIYALYEEEFCFNHPDLDIDNEGIQALDEFRQTRKEAHILHLAFSFMKTVGWISNSIIEAMIMQEGFTNE